MTEATIRTLTASVQTLVLDNQRVTRTMIRQLDSVPITQISDLMGRVRISDTEQVAIGSNQRGMLVKSEMHTGGVPMATLSGKLTFCSRVLGQHPSWVISFKWRDRAMNTLREYVDSCDVVIHRDGTCGADINGLEDELDRCLKSFDMQQAAFDLPLLICGGLS